MSAGVLFPSIDLSGTEVAPALFLAPMAGITHSGFRRLIADFGGYGALTTEMLSAPAFLREDPARSPFCRRRECEGRVVYQLRLSGEEDLGALFAKLETLSPAAVDLNLGCPAPEIQRLASGAALFRDFARLGRVLAGIRARYGGPLTVKCRLGDDPDHWREPFVERLRLFEEHAVAAVTVHPRFSGEKLKRRARWREFPWIASRTRLPVIGNGDIRSPRDIEEHAEFFRPLAGIMLGRIAVEKPWVFRQFAGLPPARVDHAEVWERLVRYTLEDLPPERALGRLKEFASYYCHNFFFGHELHRRCLGGRTVGEGQASALEFLRSNPQLSA